MKWRERHLHHWLAALRAKYQGRGRPFGEEEFDRLLGDYDGSATFCFVVTFPIGALSEGQGRMGWENSADNLVVVVGFDGYPLHQFCR